MPKKTTLRGQFLRIVLLMLACSLLVGLAVIVVVMIAFVKKVPDGEQFLMDSVSFLFGKEVLGPNGMIHVVVLAAIALCLLVVLNTASIQLLPTTVASVRAAYGSAAPFDILPAVWISSLASVTVGLLTARLLSRRKGGPA